MSADRYTLLAPSDGFVEVKGSKFICRLLPYEQYNAALALAQKEHAKASHIIPVFRYMAEDGETVVEGSSDDGEPGGTAGRPTLAVVQGAKLVNIGLYIVRYFGGTKLGTGPLARAYAASARDAIDSANLVSWEPVRELIVAVPYDDVPKMELVVRQMAPVGLERIHAATHVDYVFNGVKSAVDAAERQVVKARLLPE